MKSKENLYTARGIARHFGLPVAWIIAEADAGRLPHLQAGRQRLFSIEAVRQSLIQAASQLPKETEP